MKSSGGNIEKVGMAKARFTWHVTNQGKLIA